jgi:5-methylcytosine-specific restriction endonuclease McrA
MPKGVYDHDKIRGRKRPEHSKLMIERAEKGTLPLQHKTKEHIEKQRLTLRRKYASGKLVNAMKGKKRPDNIKRNKLMNQEGKNNGNYRHGYYFGEDNPRLSKEYKEWRLRILKRDGYTCIKCGSKQELHVDHIKSFALFPELRFEISNGRVLCKDCHMKTESYLKAIPKKRKKAMPLNTLIQATKT